MSPALEKAAAGTLFGVALNYQGLLQNRLHEFEKPPYQRPPIRPVLFIKTPNTRNGHNCPVVFPQGVERLQPGPALGVVIGKTASRVSRDDAMAHVAGYRPAVKAKCRDGFCPMGPELVPMEQIANPNQLVLKLYVNGELRQENSTANWVRDIPQLIADLSEFMTLGEGDVLITGTPEGRVDVRPGDRVEVEISGLGRLANSIVAEEA